MGSGCSSLGEGRGKRRTLRPVPSNILSPQKSVQLLGPSNLEASSRHSVQAPKTRDECNKVHPN